MEELLTNIKENYPAEWLIKFVTTNKRVPTQQEAETKIRALRKEAFRTGGTSINYDLLWEADLIEIFMDCET